MFFSAHVLPHIHFRISSVLFFFLFRYDLLSLRQFPSSIYQESSKNFSARGENPSVPVEILNKLTIHDRWICETKVIILTCKTTGGRNHSLYLHRSICGCKGVAYKHCTSKTCALDVNTDHTINAGEAHDLNKLWAHCPTITVFMGFWVCFFICTQETLQTHQLLMRIQHDELPWKMSWLREGNLIFTELM